MDETYPIDPGTLLGAYILRAAVYRHRKTLRDFEEASAQISSPFGTDVQDQAVATARDMLKDLRERSEAAGIEEGRGVEQICQECPAYYTNLMSLPAVRDNVHRIVRIMVQEACEKLDQE